MIGEVYSIKITKHIAENMFEPCNFSNFICLIKTHQNIIHESIWSDASLNRSRWHNRGNQDVKGSHLCFRPGELRWIKVGIEFCPRRARAEDHGEPDTNLPTDQERRGLCFWQQKACINSHASVFKRGMKALKEIFICMVNIVHHLGGPWVG